ncbi:MAG: glucose-1-phosphate cytidylyltransferase [Pseudomonadota bacterium]|nr:glucose-1-phosphate cytidylyltransferase [Pseudomonadota bacterium]
MKAVLLAGGLGTRLSEETSIRPKPMVEIGGKPILWHIMKIYHGHGIKEFIVCCGYKGFVIKEYFANYRLYMSDVTFDIRANEMKIHQSDAEDWKVTLVDTGVDTMTGGRMRRVQDYLGDETFLMTYGDGVGDIDIGKLISFHREQGTLATLTAVQPSGRFGAFTLTDDQKKIDHFREKPRGDNAWINGGYFVLEPEVLDYIEGDDTVWERDPMERLASEGRLSAYQHHGFWHPMDTLRDRDNLESIWESRDAPWKNW